MRDLIHKKERFIDIVLNYSPLYRYDNLSEKLVYSSGVMNFFWNQWNNFWRDYWLSHVNGGFYLDGSKISPLCLNHTDKQACHFLLHKLGKKKKHTNEAINGCYQEATWGDPNVIESLAVSLSSEYAHMGYLLGILSIYKNDLFHFQIIRNTFTHLNNENVYHLSVLSGQYSFSPGQKILDILEATNINSSTRCFDNLVNSMSGMLNNL